MLIGWIVYDSIYLLFCLWRRFFLFRIKCIFKFNCRLNSQIFDPRVVVQRMVMLVCLLVGQALTFHPSQQKNRRCTQYIYNLIGSLPWNLKRNVPQRIDPYLSRDKGPVNSIKRPNPKVIWSYEDYLCTQSLIYYSSWPSNSIVVNASILQWSWKYSLVHDWK